MGALITIRDVCLLGRENRLLLFQFNFKFVDTFVVGVFWLDTHCVIFVFYFYRLWTKQAPELAHLLNSGR